MSTLTRSVLQRYWGYSSFRPLQEDIVDSAVQGRDALALLPTGGGKSICFQVPAMSMDGVCVVISPLIALMKDQVEHLKARGIEAAAVFSGMHPMQIEVAYNQAVFGRLKFLYVSPERLLTDQFLAALRRMKVCLLAVDESHCISQWGYDFRPPYLRIAEIRSYIPNTPVLALTATATSRVVDDIQYRLGFKEKLVFRSSFERKNVTYNVVKEADKYGVLFRLFERLKQGSGIVYVRNRKRTQVIAEWLQASGISATYYHAGLEAKLRDQRQNMWMRGEVRVMVATNAFGMGIDKPDVRLVVHMDLPDSLEAYFQEAGRAGRDLQPSSAYLIVSESDIKQLRDNLEASFPTMDRVKAVYQALCTYCGIVVGYGKDTSYPFVLGEFIGRYGFSALEVFSTLKMFERDGMIAMTDGFEHPSKVYVTAGRDDLFRVQQEYPDLEAIVSYLLRNLPGVMTDYVTIDEETMARKMRVNLESLEIELSRLAKMGYISYVPRSEKPRIMFLSDCVDVLGLNLSNDTYRNRKAEAEQRIEAVLDFVNTDTICRSTQLLAYFDEDAASSCGRCDVCCKRQKMSNHDASVEELNDAILRAIGDNGVSIKELLLNFDHHQEEQVLEAVRWMIDNGVLHRSGDCLLR